MAFNPYDSCPCGSGKKFKWCCQDTYAEIDEAFRQAAAGQHEAALKQMERVAQAHSGNPEVHGRHAQLLAARGNYDEAEQALERAFAINPNYAFGHLLRGQFRAAEGELVGAARLFHKAADLYSPDAHEHLAIVHELIAEAELKLNRPVAARAALKRAARFSPDSRELRDTLDALFGPKSRLPEAACKDYAFQRPTAASQHWDRALAEAATGRLSDVQRVFQLWVKKHPDDPAAWYNLGLIDAWIGDNADGVAALAEYVERELDEHKAAAAWTLAEVLLCGHGLEAEADYVEHRAVMLMRDPQPIVPWLQEWEREHRLIGLASNPETGMLSALVLEQVTSLVLSGAAAPPARLAAYLLVTGNVLQLWHPIKESLDRVLAEVQQRLGPALGEAGQAIGPAHFGDVVIEALLFPTAATTQLDAETKIRSHAQEYFEDIWPHRPLKALRGTPPIDAAGHPQLRKRLRGVVTFLEQCASQTTLRLYDFARLRHKLGLDETAPAPQSTAAPDATRDLTAMSAADLAGLTLTDLPDADLDAAFRAALKLDSPDLAERFARALTERPAPPGADRYPFFQHLVAAAQAANDYDAALKLIDAGLLADRSANDSKREIDYETRRGQLQAKRGDGGAAIETFERILGKEPGNLKAAGSASEALLGAKNAAAALQFAERGLAQAREQNNRDMEGYFLELSYAARRQGA